MAKVTNGEVASVTEINPETYLGTLRSRQQGLISIRTGTHTYPRSSVGSLAAPRAVLLGRWTATAEYIRSDRAAASILLGVHAQSVNLVLATETGKPLDVLVASTACRSLPPTGARACTKTRTAERW